MIIKSEKRMLSVSLSSILGSRLLRSSVNDTETALNTSKLTPGTYVLSVETEEGVFHFKVVK
ncbi:MAG: hypothetical protein CRN43_13360 [Candidatus Nephrothrix sp. EaCA]|nr:MAG: hypothetical protein CRN43_13360 [Candidatus Nephrothrix sp. EaCA]